MSVAVTLVSIVVGVVVHSRRICIVVYLHDIPTYIYIDIDW